MPKIKKNPGNLFYTYGNYTGPGNRTDPEYLRKYRPVDRLDRAAKFHDLAYQKYQKQGRNPYFRFSEADQLFLDRVSRIPGIPARVASGAFQVKKAVNSLFGMVKIKGMKRPRRNVSRMPARKRQRAAAPVSSFPTSFKRRKGRRSKARKAVRSTAAVNAHYTGKLRSIRKARKPGKYDRSGFHQEFERYGTQTLNEVCYLGASSFAKNDLGPCIGIAFMRKVMKRHYQYEYEHPDQYITPTISGLVGSGPRAIAFYRRVVDPIGATSDVFESAYSFNFNNASGVVLTLREAGNLFYEQVLNSGAFGGINTVNGIANFTQTLYGYQFIESDYTVNAVDPGGAPVSRYTHVHSLEGQYFTCYSSVKMAVQNVTPADNNGLSTTQVDTNPIKGKLMKFKDMVPTVRQVIRSASTPFGNAVGDGSSLLQIDPNGDGIIKPANSLIGAWQQIPISSMFTNATGEVPVSISPGGIKDYSVIFKFNGTLQKFILGAMTLGETSVNPGAPISNSSTKQFGTSFLFMLEKRMPTGGAAVSVNFHYESHVGAVFGRKAGVVMQRGAGASTAVTLA